MKKKIFATVLPILAGITLVGTGFSVWYFTSTNTTAELSVDVDMAGYVSVGSLTPTPSAKKLYLDSTTTGDNGHNGINLMSSDSDYVSGNDITLTFTATTETSGTISGNATVTLTLTVDNGVDNYIVFGLEGETFTPNPGESTTTYTYTTDLIAVNSATVSIDMPAFTFAYEEGKEPTDVNSYNTLAGVITDSTITIKYELNWAN